LVCERKGEFGKRIEPWSRIGKFLPLHQFFPWNFYARI
jgi:hypothetical protein